MDWKQRCEELENRVSELEAENRELRRKLGMCDPKPFKPIPTTAVHHHSTPAEKINLFRSLFRGREDVFARRWYSTKTEKAGYAPMCANEWKPGVCIKPKGTCSKCDHRELVPLSDQVIYNHLSGLDAYGRDVVGLYPILPDDTCFFLAIDFDDGAWQENVSAVRNICTEWNIPCAVERSRSGEGAHLWIFFSDPLPCSTARKLGSMLLTAAMEQEGSLKLDVEPFDGVCGKLWLCASRGAAAYPEYMFILDRSTATGAADEGVMGAREVIANELIRELDVYKNGRIVYFIEHANVWYTSTGGVQALDTMLSDLEGALLN